MKEDTMIIIFEGCDGVGKTTLVDRTAALVETMTHHIPRVLHRGPPTRDPLVEYTLDLESVSASEWVLCDRWHWGELVYGPIYRGASLLGDAGRQAIDEFLARRGAVLLHVDNSAHVVMERLQSRGDDYVKMEHIPQILEAYRDLRERPSPLKRRTLYGDITTAQLKSIINDAEELMKGKGW